MQHLSTSPKGTGVREFNYSKKDSLVSYTDSLFKNFLIIKYLKFLKIYLFWLYYVACGLLVPQPGMEPVLPAVEEIGRAHV